METCNAKIILKISKVMIKKNYTWRSSVTK